MFKIIIKPNILLTGNRTDFCFRYLNSQISNLVSCLKDYLLLFCIIIMSKIVKKIFDNCNKIFKTRFNFLKMKKTFLFP